MGTIEFLGLGCRLLDPRRPEFELSGGGLYTSCRGVYNVGLIRRNESPDGNIASFRTDSAFGRTNGGRPMFRPLHSNQAGCRRFQPPRGLILDNCTLSSSQACLFPLIEDHRPPTRSIRGITLQLPARAAQEDRTPATVRRGSGGQKPGAKSQQVSRESFPFHGTRKLSASARGKIAAA